MTLRTRLTAAFVLVVLLPLLVGSLLVTRAVPRAVASGQQETVVSSARLAGLVVASYCSRLRVLAESAARTVVTAPRAAERQHALAQLLEGGAADGVVVRTSGGAIGAGRLPPVGVGDCSTSAPSTEPYLAAVVRVTTSRGAPAGTAIAAVRVDSRLAARLRDAAGEGTVALLSGDRVVSSAGQVSRAAVRAVTAAEPGAAVEVEGRTVAIERARPGQPFSVLVSRAQRGGPSLLLVALGVLLAAVAFATVIARALARATTQPLEELGAAAARIAGGDLETVIPVRSRDEVGQLAHAFNSMTDELRVYVRALEASRDDLQANVSRLGDALSGTHDLDRILTVVLDTAMASVRASSGMVLLVSPEREELRLTASRGLTGRAATRDLRVRFGAGVTGRVAQTDAALSGRVGDRPGELKAARGEPTGTSVVAVPLRSSGRVLGVLALYGRVDADEFNDADLAMIRSFAGQASVAVDNVLLHEEAQRMSLTDALTGLWNYRYFTMTVGKEIDRSARFERPLALLMLDLDHFKQVNDTLGHQRGDAVLAELAVRLRAEVRDVDTVARYGGEEVVVILPETDEDGAVQAADRICDAVRQRPFGDPEQEPAHVTVSIGVAVFPQHGGTASSLLRRADAALYDAKRAGRDTWRMATGGADAGKTAH